MNEHTDDFISVLSQQDFALNGKKILQVPWRCHAAAKRVLRGTWPGGARANGNDSGRYFLALCEERSFTRAARRCGVSQPSLTLAIKRLEQSLGGPLFYRGRANTRLTELGILVRREFVRIDRSVANVKHKATKFSAARSITHHRNTMEAFMRAHQSSLLL